MTKAQMKAWYRNGLTDAQLDGTGASDDSLYKTKNYVSLGVITQADADAIRAQANAKDALMEETQ